MGRDTPAEPAQHAPVPEENFPATYIVLQYKFRPLLASPSKPPTPR